MRTRHNTISDSSLPLVARCPAAAVLPWIGSSNEKADMGSAFHDHREAAVRHGLGEANRRLPGILAKWDLVDDAAAIVAWKCRVFEWLPPPGAIAETALCIGPDGDVVRVKGGQGRYELPAGHHSPGTFDLCWSEPVPLDMTDPDNPVCPPGSVLWVADYKTGNDTWVKTVENNEQLHSLGVKAARWTRAGRLQLAVIYPGKGEGTWDVIGPLGPEEIDRMEQRLAAIREAVREQDTRLSTGEPLRLIEGQHCRWCPARLGCPAKVGLLMAVVGGEMEGALTPKQARRLAEILPEVESFARRVREVLLDRVEAEGAIELGDGVVWGPQTTEREVIDGATGSLVLNTTLGEHAGPAIRVSKKGVGDAIRAWKQATGEIRSQASIRREIFRDLAHSGALRKVRITSYRAHRPGLDEDDDEVTL